jgi:hypothetical protein
VQNVVHYSDYKNLQVWKNLAAKLTHIFYGMVLCTTVNNYKIHDIYFIKCKKKNPLYLFMRQLGH